ILAYSGVDALAWLNRPYNVEDVRAADFQEWLEAYFLPGSGFGGTTLDLYGARCGLVHSNTSESRLNRQDRARKVFYYRDRDQVKTGIIQLLMNERLPPLFIDVDQFVAALKTAVERFLNAVAVDAAKLDLVSRRVEESYFSSHVMLGRPER